MGSHSGWIVGFKVAGVKKKKKKKRKKEKKEKKKKRKKRKRKGMKRRSVELQISCLHDLNLPAFPSFHFPFTPTEDIMESSLQPQRIHNDSIFKSPPNIKLKSTKAQPISTSSRILSQQLCARMN